MSEPPLPRVVGEALRSVPTWSWTVRGTTWSPSSKRTVTLPSAPRWNSLPPADRERLSVAETGSLSGQATPYVPSPLSSFVTCRNSAQVQGCSGVGMRTPDFLSRDALAISTRGSWRNGTP
ncbi:hypothetical protein STENM327S_02879 [Streptomyces tendae]